MKTEKEIKEMIDILEDVNEKFKGGGDVIGVHIIRGNKITVSTLEWVLKKDSKTTVEELKSCKTCHGRGFQVGGGDSVDYGSTTVRLPTYPEPCEDCTGHGLCPSCGSVILPTTANEDNFEDWWNNPTSCPNPECGWEPTKIKNF